MERQTMVVYPHNYPLRKALTKNLTRGKIKFMTSTMSAASFTTLSQLLERKLKLTKANNLLVVKNK